MPEEKNDDIESSQKDGQRHLYVKSAITSDGTTQYYTFNFIIIMYY